MRDWTTGRIWGKAWVLSVNIIFEEIGVLSCRSCFISGRCWFRSILVLGFGVLELLRLTIVTTSESEKIIHANLKNLSLRFSFLIFFTQ